MSIRRSGYRSGLEEKVVAALARRSVTFEYEEHTLVFTPKARHYTPDLYLPLQDIYIEIKGYFLAKDRSKHLMIKDQYPDLDLRFVFSNPNNKLSKKSKTTYAGWCDRHGFLWAKGFVPKEWL